jgi:hypothetical protein
MGKSMPSGKMISRALLALSFALALTSARATEQLTTVMPITGPMDMHTYGGKLNDAHRAIMSCSWGSSAPANGPSSAPIVYQCWVDTTANPSLYKIYDGASWITLGSINTSTHVWAPYFTGGVSGGVPFFSATNVMGSSAVLAQYGFMGWRRYGSRYRMVSAQMSILRPVVSTAPTWLTVR